MESLMSDLEKLVPTVEALIFAAGGPIGAARIRRALPELSVPQIAGLVDQVNHVLREQGRPYEIAEIAGGYQFRTRAEYAELIRGMQPERKVRLSRAALETLALIAYRQPITRAEVDDVRCVDCGAVIRGLLERGLVRIVGRRDAPGRPVLYATSTHFLEAFGLSSLSDLPELRELVAPEPTRESSPESAPENDGGRVAAPESGALAPEAGEELLESAEDSDGVWPETEEPGSGEDPEPEDAGER